MSVHVERLYGRTLKVIIERLHLLAPSEMYIVFWSKVGLKITPVIVGISALASTHIVIHDEQFGSHIRHDPCP